MEARVFYAWQSDRPDKANRSVIRKAAEQACQRITDDKAYSWTVQLDSDTRGAAGMCDIPATILKKIEDCDIFLGDLTLVGNVDQQDNDPQQMPNANVVFELGYAAKCHGFDAIVGIVNQAFGSVEGQVFDIKRRASLKYELAPAATPDERRRAIDRLAEELEHAFRTILDKVVAPRRSFPTKQDELSKEMHSTWVRQVFGRKFHGFRLLPATVISVHSSRKLECEYESTFETISSRVSNAKPLPHGIAWRGDHDAGELNLDDSSIVQVFGGDYEYFKALYPSTTSARLRGPDPPRLLPAQQLLTHIVRHIVMCSRVFQSVHAAPPWRVYVSLVGVKGFQLVFESSNISPTRAGSETIDLPPLVVADANAVRDQFAVGALLRATFGRLLREFGESYNPYYDSHGNWNVRDVTLPGYE